MKRKAISDDEAIALLDRFAALLDEKKLDEAVRFAREHAHVRTSNGRLWKTFKLLNGLRRMKGKPFVELRGRRPKRRKEKRR